MDTLYFEIQRSNPVPEKYWPNISCGEKEMWELILGALNDATKKDGTREH